MGLRSLKRSKLNKVENTFREESPFIIDGLTCRYGDKTVFSNVRLSVDPGDIVGIVGDNGAGKTTLVRCIAGLHQESKGSITLNGERLSKKKRQTLSAMVMQDVNYQLFTDSIVEECRLGNDCTHEEIEAVVQELGLSDFKELHPMVLSGGQKQRLVIANAILSEKKVLIFDEPTSGLDYYGMIAVSRQLKKLSEKGHFMFVVSHDVEFINETCTKLFAV